jgi:hypothetical protein
LALVGFPWLSGFDVGDSISTGTQAAARNGLHVAGSMLMHNSKQRTRRAIARRARQFQVLR